MAVDLDHLYEFFTGIKLEPFFLIPGFFGSKVFSNPGRPIHALVFDLCCIAIPCLGGLLLRHSVSAFVKKTAKNLILWAQQRIEPRSTEE
jgi:uncharacterized membrane protein YcfT